MEAAGGVPSSFQGDISCEVSAKRHQARWGDRQNGRHEGANESPCFRCLRGLANWPGPGLVGEAKPKGPDVIYCLAVCAPPAPGGQNCRPSWSDLPYTEAPAFIEPWDCCGGAGVSRSPKELNRLIASPLAGHIPWGIAECGSNCRARSCPPASSHDHHLRRITALRPHRPRLLEVTAERAGADADRIDAGLAAGEALAFPWPGCHLAIKDNSAQRDSHHAPARIAWRTLFRPTITVTERLWQAGAVLLGKTNLDEFRHGQTRRRPPPLAQPQFPLGPERVPGGSFQAACGRRLARR